MYGDGRKVLLGGIVEPAVGEEAQVGNSVPVDDLELVGMSMLLAKEEGKTQDRIQLVLLPNIHTSLSLPSPFVIDRKWDNESLCLGLLAAQLIPLMSYPILWSRSVQIQNYHSYRVISQIF